jgi:hypothetical protein
LDEPAAYIFGEGEKSHLQMSYTEKEMELSRREQKGWQFSHKKIKSYNSS